MNEFAQREHISTRIYPGADQACAHVADAIDKLLRTRQQEGRPAVLGLATGSTPVRLYRELIRRHREEGLSFAHAVTFNLDEYYGLDGSHPESYRRFMQEQLFDHIDIDPANTHVPDGTAAREQVFDACQSYEDAIAQVGGIDIQILGIGRTGHIGFNEPGSGTESRTRLVTLDALTRRDAARDFLGEENVPRHAITMGVGSILEARQIFLLAWGESKATIVAETVEGEQRLAVPASFLQRHKACTFCLDTAAASHLTRIRYPWLVGPVEWTPALIRKAITWLALQVKKPLLKLVDEDYSENGMSDLLTEKGSYNLNIELFNLTQHTITGWPGGKPNADDSHRPERALPHPKRVLVLSPEPLDDVSSMGGTLHRLANQGHEVTVAYLTSGNLAVPDDELRRMLEWMMGMQRDYPEQPSTAYAAQVMRELEAKGKFDLDSADIRHLKGLVRRGEVNSSARILGLSPASLRFLDLPFYEEGRYRRFKPGEADIARMRELLLEIRPHQIFATGYRYDPLSVPALCFGILNEALASFKDEEWLRDCRVWLYRGPGNEWETHEIDMAVPLSPSEFENKMQGIYQQQSQRSQSPGLGKKSDGNSWDVAAELNHGTARTYDALGLPEYEAIEAFKRWPL